MFDGTVGCQVVIPFSAPAKPLCYGNQRSFLCPLQNLSRVPFLLLGGMAIWIWTRTWTPPWWTPVEMTILRHTIPRTFPQLQPKSQPVTGMLPHHSPCYSDPISFFHKFLHLSSPKMHTTKCCLDCPQQRPLGLSSTPPLKTALKNS